MDADSDAEIQNRSNESRRNVNNPSNEGQQSKPKRQMKTPFQLETLEKAYACPYTSLLFLYIFYFFLLFFMLSLFIILCFFRDLIGRNSIFVCV